MHKIELENLANRLEMLPTLAKWHASQWKNAGPDREAFFLNRVGHDIPCVLVATEATQPVGFVSLIKTNHPSKPELTPWLSSLFVLPELRNEGIGKFLVNACIEKARAHGHSKLFLMTADKAAYYERLGWQRHEIVQRGGKQLTVMTLQIP